MKKSITIALLLIINLFSISNINAQFNNKLYNGINLFLSLECDDNKNIIVSAFDYSTKTTIIKTDSNNQNTIWSKQLFNNASYSLTKIFQNNVYVISNITKDTNKSAVLTKLDINGNYLWSKVIRTNYDLLIQKLVVVNQTKDIFIGLVSGGYENAIIKLDSLGNFLWCKEYAPQYGNFTVQDLKEDMQGNILILSDGSLNPYSNRIPLLFKIDLNGNLIWNKFYPSSTIYEGQRISNLTMDSKKNIYFINDLNLPNSELCKNSIYKTDPLGNLQWIKYYAFPYLDISVSLSLTTDLKDNLYYLGNGLDTIGHGVNLNFLKINASNGEVKKSWVDTGSARTLPNFQYIKCINPNRIVLAGFQLDLSLLAGVDSLANGVCFFSPSNVIANTISSYDTSVSFMIFQKYPIVLDTILSISNININSSKFCISDGVSENIKNTKLEVYPNPFKNELVISNQNNEEFELHIYNSLGEKIISEYTTDSIHLNTSQLSKGMYIYVLRNKEGIIRNGKVIRE